LTVSLHFLLYIAYRTNIVSTEYEYSNKNCVFASDLVAVSSGGCITGRLVRDDQPADDGLGKDIKDGVGVSFTLHGDDTNLLDRSGTKSATVSLGSLSGVAARAGRAVDSSEDPDNGVANPGEERKIDNVAKKFQDGARIAATAASSASGGFFSDFGEEVHDGEESKHGEAEESPLFVASDEFADEAGNNHEDVHKHEEDLHELVTTVSGVSECDEFIENDGSSNGPIDVSSVVEIAAVAFGDVTISKGHREVGERSNHADNTSTHANLVPAFGARGTILNVFVATPEEVEGGGEEKAKGNPKDNRVVDFIVLLGVDGAARARA